MFSTDHYLGFEKIFADPNIGFHTVFQNGLVERPVSGTFVKVGGVEKDPTSGINYLTKLSTNNTDIEDIFSNNSGF